MNQITVKFIERNEDISASNEVYIEIPESNTGGKFYKINPINLAEEIGKVVENFINEKAMYL